MKQTLTQKILAKASGSTAVETGDVVWAKVDILMSHDPCSPGVIGIFKREFGEEARVFDRERFIMIPDHFVFSADPLANANVRTMRKFAAEQQIRYFYDVGSPAYKGVCHVALAEGGHNRPGEVLLGTDSHTVTSGAFGTFAIGVGNTDAAFALGAGQVPLKVPATIRVDLVGEMPRHLLAKDLILAVIGQLGLDGATYQALEFGGEVIDALSVEERMTICNMVVECGGKNGIMVPNQATLEYVHARSDLPFEVLRPDTGAEYSRHLTIDVSRMDSVVAKPHSPDNIADAGSLLDTVLDRAYIGSCTGGKLEDFVAAARVLRGNKVRIPTFAVPATREVLDGMIRTRIDGPSVFEIFQDAGVAVSTSPGCAACCGGPVDTFGRVDQPQRVISTTNRNFVGRMGHKSAQIYLASPYTVAASALKGSVVSARDYF
ncbi:aconitase/3-isopropylmalate dehydratase large subunit family protein [Aquabacterium sp. A7-Y]|uniref:3-isopropylmalate dehydratase large subunit n=1 Tax=Aquabacterium sp. A7-Y TaxID=1349605 RepID=UPI00223D772E|nr:aconitase/3-isopropylmalate dehydratase large subunit family protein [Aquabacterium sp. A7-Y]MCW7538193.1 aconitase/3-isopropylmalate dehydratase large subunit family protein [Aquabacterium sp. A7-Y]